MAPFFDYTLPADIPSPRPEVAEGMAEGETIFVLLALLPVLLLAFSLLFAAYIVSRSRQQTAASIPVLGFLRRARTVADGASPLLPAGPAALGSHESESTPPTPTLATTVFEKVRLPFRLFCVVLN